MLMIDANATTGDIVSTSIGDSGTRLPENRGGRFFHQYLKDTKLTAVNTVVDSDTHDWTYRKGGKVERIDYIAIPTDHVDTATAADVIDTLDMHQPDEDHLPLAMHQSYTAMAHSKGTHPPLDKRKMADPAIVESFRRELAMLTPCHGGPSLTTRPWQPTTSFVTSPTSTSNQKPDHPGSRTSATRPRH